MSLEVEQALLSMLSRREYAVNEARQKLHQKGYSTDDIEPVMQDYVARRLICDERFKIAKVGSLQARGYGPNYIKMLLAQMGLSFYQDDFDWCQAYQIALRKAGRKERIKLKQYLYRRGFTGEY
jgi:SOS response regulatory protein OraA/RecX